VGNGRDRVLWRTLEVAMAPWRRGRLYVRALGTPARIANDRPVLLVANHVSWWDGFLLRAVQRAVRPQAALRTIALERELVRHPILRRIGGIGIEPSSPSSILHALRELARLRSDDLVLGYFPQGYIRPSHARPLGFHRGIDLVMNALAPAAVVPVALHVEPLAHFAPTAFVAVGAAIDGATVDHATLELRLTRLLDEVLGFVAVHGEEADRAWSTFRPGEFDAAAPFTRPRLAC
jgi:1-acyl-sn-glycerol-3-phosphate acyltransferase